MNTFLTELNRAPEYVPLLTGFYTQLITHISTFGDVNNSFHLQFDIHKVFKTLQMMNAPLKSTSLQPPIARPTLSLPTSSLPNSTIFSDKDYKEFIACLEVTIDEVCIHPMICAKMTNNRDRCQACLIGFH